MVSVNVSAGILRRIDLRGTALSAARLRDELPRGGVDVDTVIPKVRPIVETVARRGAEAALAAGVHKLTIPVSASAAHSLANVRKTREEMVAEVRAIVRLRDAMAPGVKVEAGISTAFGCTLQGEVPEDDVVWLAGECIAAGADESGLSDTTGMANPAQVRRLFTRVHEELGSKSGAAG